MKTVILLDDDPDEQGILQDAFDQLDLPVQVLQFLTYTALCNYLSSAEKLPAMLFLDVNLPIQTGIDCIQLLKTQERFRRLPVAMYSNACDPQTIHQSLMLGATAYLQKTSSLARLKDQLQRLMSWNLETVGKLQEGERILLR